MAKKPIKVSTSNVLYQKAPEGVYPIEESDWKRIKDLAEGIKCPKNILGLFGAACWGVSGSACVQWIYCVCCLRDGEKWYEGVSLVLLVLCVVSGICGFFLYLLDKEKKTSMEDAGKKIVKEMNNLETSYTLPGDESAIELMSQKIENAQ